MQSTMLIAVCSLLIYAVVVSGQDEEFQCPERTGFYPDPYQCDLYYSCTQGKAETKLCPDGLVFSDKSSNHEHCDIPLNVECGDRTELQEPKPTKGCPRANGFYRHSDPEVCDKFYNCIDGVANEMPCPPGLIYDDMKCAWPAESKRKCENSKRDLLADGFSCPNGETVGPNGRALPHPTFPHPEDCRKFYICRNGVDPQYGSCVEGEVYNEETFKCDEPESVPGCENYYEGKEIGKKSKKN
ncbi:protein obstructor-E-like [Arctopsyche grandis]|uniref:protein obstructor-E-like n=1 Tax=Arctopsyche grandis TaxID=121162 RepID=UPI00406D6A60